MGCTTGTRQPFESGKIYQRVLLILCLVAVLGCRGATAYTYVAGGGSGWVLPVEANGLNYTEQAAAQSFVVGDSVEFNYDTTEHSVLIVTKAAFDSCNLTSPLKSYITSPTTVVLNEAKTWYFICGFPGHCNQNQVLEVNVASNSTAAPPAAAPTGTGDSSGSPTILAPTQTAVAFTAVILLGKVFLSV